MHKNFFWDLKHYSVISDSDYTHTVFQSGGGFIKPQLVFNNPVTRGNLFARKCLVKSLKDCMLILILKI